MTRKKKEDSGSDSMIVPVIVIMVVIGLTVLAVVLAIQQSGGGGNDNDDNGTVIVDDDGDEGSSSEPYMDISLLTTDGSRVKLSDYTGRVVLLDMFATWCSPCRTQLGELDELRSMYSSSELIILSVDVDLSETINQISDFREEAGSSWPFAKSTDEFNNYFPATSIPTLYMLDGTGSIVYSHVGVEYASSIASEINKHLD